MAKTRLSKSEKISTVLSVIAILVSVISPLTTYYWLDPQIQAFKNRAILQLSAQPKAGIINPHVENTEGFTLPVRSDYLAEIINVGPLPAKDVVLTLQYDRSETTDSMVEFDPPVPTSVKIEGSSKFITLNQPIAPMDKVGIKLYRPPNTMWVTSEFGERNSVTITSNFQLMLEMAKPGDTIGFNPDTDHITLTRSGNSSK